MKLLISVVNSDDEGPLVDTLMSEGYRATVISTTGGFLRQGNATLLTGVADERVNDVLGIVKDKCHTRTAYLNTFPSMSGPEGVYASMPVEIPVGGAVVFILNIERFERF